MIKVKCKICKDEFLTYESKSNRKITCSKECCSKLRRIKMKNNKFAAGNTNRKGVKLSEKTKEKQKISFKKWYSKEKHPNYGKKLSKKIKDKKSRSMKLAYNSGKMEHMNSVWKENSKRWLGDKNPRWTGGWYIDKHNYKWVHDDKSRWRKEHRVVAERILGRDLERHETIHHIDEDKLNNCPENLYYFKNDSLHKRHHGLKNKPKLKSNLIGQ